MDRHNRIYISCIFVITCQIACGQNYYGYYGYGGDNVYDDSPPNGYHYETMNEVLRNYQLGTYMIVPLSSSPLGTASGSGTAGGGGGNAAIGDAAGDTTGDNAGEEQTSDGANAEQSADATATARKRRSFFDFSLPSFMSSDVNETTTKSTTVVNGGGDEKTTTTGTTTDVKTITSSDAAEGNTTMSSTTTVNTTAAAGTGFMSYYTNAAEVTVVGIGKQLGSSMVVAAPYLPIVYKVATFIVPGLSSYQALLLAVNVATITTEAVRHYEGGQSFTKVATDAGYQALKSSMLSRRDTGSTINKYKEYASNVYDSLKQALIARYETYKPYFFQRIANFSIGTPDPKINMNHVETKITHMYVNGVEIPETETIVTTNYKSGAGMPGPLSNRKPMETEKIDKKLDGRIRDNIIDESSWVSGEDNDSNEEIDKTDKVIVDPSNFNRCLKASIKDQPEEVKNLNGEQLKNYLNDLKIDLPEPRIDSEKIFEALTSQFKFDESVTADQINELNKTLSTITNYFISKQIELMKSMKLNKN